MIHRDDKDNYFRMFIKGTEMIYYFYEVPDTEQVLNNKADNEEEDQRKMWECGHGNGLTVSHIEATTQKGAISNCANYCRQVVQDKWKKY